jgi:MFS family permease
MLAGLVLQEVAFGLTEPVLAGWTNEHVPSERRATLLSVRSTFFTLGGAAGLVLIGLVGRAAGVPTAWAVSAAVFAAIVPGYLLLERVSRRVSTAATVPA